MFLGRLMRSAMVLISLKAFSMARSELLMVRRFWYFELPNSSKLAAPVPCGSREQVLISHADTEDVVTTEYEAASSLLCRNLNSFACKKQTPILLLELLWTGCMATAVTETTHLAYHSGEVASVEQWVLSISHSRWVFEGFLVGKSPPL